MDNSQRIVPWKRVVISCSFLFLLHPVLGQRDEPLFNAILRELHELPKKDFDQNALLSTRYFFDQQFDSTLVYTSNFLSRPTSRDMEDFCHFFRGYSLMEKRLFEGAKEEFHAISKSFPLEAAVKMQLGGAYIELEAYQKALETLQQLSKRDDLEVSGLNKGKILHNIGLSYLHLEQFDDAENFMIQALEYHRAQSDIKLQIGSTKDLANVYYIQYKDDEAIPFFVESYELSKRVEDFELKMSSAGNMAVVEENRGNLEAALKYRNEYDSWKDSLNAQNELWQTTQDEKRKLEEENRKREHNLQVENEIKEAQRNGLLYSLIFLALLLVSIFYFYRQRVRANRVISKQKNELDELNSMKDRLFSIVSHDLRSSVNALRINNGSLIKKAKSGDYQKVSKLLNQNGTIANNTYVLLDNLLNWALLQTEQLYFHKEVVKLRSLVDQSAFNYLPLMDERSIEYENRVDESVKVNVDMDSMKIVLRNLIDNAIKYSPNGGHIFINSEVNDGEIRLIVEDSGQGMSQELIQKLLSEDHLVSEKSKEQIGSGLGLQLCKTMIEQNEGRLKIESEPGVGTKMIILFSKA